MKIHDIISEPTIVDYLRETDKILAKKGIILSEDAAATAGNFASGFKAGASAPTLKGYSQAASGAAEKAGVVAGQTTSKMNRVLRGKINKELTMYDLKGDKVEKFIPKTAFKFMVVLKWLGMLPFFYEYWQDKTAIDSLEKKQELSADDASAAQRIVIEELVTKIVVSASFANLLKWLLRLRYIKYATMAAGAVASGATLGLFGGPSIIAILATEAAALWLEKFLQSEAGKEVVAYCVIYAIDPAVTWVWNMGPGAWSKALHAPELTDAAKEKVAAASTADGKADAKVAAAGSATFQGAQPAGSAKGDVDSTSSNTLAAKPFDASGGYQKWGTSDPYANLPKLNDIKLK